MINSFITSLQDWHKTYSERAKLQHLYVVLIITITLLAGLVTLINPDLGQSALQATGMIVVVFIANAVSWALLKSFVLDRLTARKTTKK